ncbi:hypothetical protein [Nannocystis punicea]|uniref:Peptidase M1 membrane alanine aminopeptidase domain-containing protein n=1 Tax=Nannocystis punicea TaxID=2995304 RepID=A0ABY7GUZ0_9BACT|nr:hypothetical protein [Nannocystis poenicansa]WAS90772.1 hypothetical protein O0S08_31680 [Nannocystis poenicansa]
MTVCAAALVASACQGELAAPDTDGSTTSTTSATTETTTQGEAETTTEQPTTTGDVPDTTGEPPPSCEALPGAPPPVEVADVLIVPIDVTRVDAELRFDAAAGEAVGRATLEFRSGPVEGLPAFDLRQPIDRAVLDGVELPANGIVPFNPPSEVTMLAINRKLAPCGEHRLELEYHLDEPFEEDARSFVWVEDAVAWGTHLGDYFGGRFTEKWVPGSLIHDVHDLELEIVVEGGAPHELVANAPVTAIADNHWTIAFPEITSMTPLVQLCPSASVLRDEFPADAIDVLVWRCELWPGSADDVTAFADELVPALQFATEELGPYPHGDRFLAVVLSHDGGSMEYPGGTVTRLEAVRHEVFHNWIARSVRPLTQRDAWFDEAWTTWAIEDGFEAPPLSPDHPPITLAGDNLWTRITPFPSYETGPQLLSTIAAEVGLAELRALLREFYQAHAGQAVTTEQLERFLDCRIDGGRVRALFHRFVHGQDGDPPPLAPERCDSP